MQRPCADVNSPYKRKCWTNSGGPLVNSVLWGIYPLVTGQHLRSTLATVSHCNTVVSPTGASVQRGRGIKNGFTCPPLAKRVSRRVGWGGLIFLRLYVVEAAELLLIPPFFYRLVKLRNGCRATLSQRTKTIYRKCSSLLSLVLTHLVFSSSYKYAIKSLL